MSLIDNKKEKILTIFKLFGDNLSEEQFIEKFKKQYPSDWEAVQQRWKIGIPDMQHPDVYMKEMYRNHKKLFEEAQGNSFKHN